MNKVNQKRAMRLIVSAVKTLNFTSNMIGLRAVLNPMEYPILQLYANLNLAKTQIDEVQVLLDPDRIRKLKEMGHWPVPKEVLTEEDKLRAELNKAKAQIRKLKEEQAVSRKVAMFKQSNQTGKDKRDGEGAQQRQRFVRGQLEHDGRGRQRNAHGC